MPTGFYGMMRWIGPCIFGILRKQRATFATARNVLLLERHIRDHELHGRDATLAREILDTFRLTQTHFPAHRDQILRELNQPSS